MGEAEPIPCSLSPSERQIEIEFGSFGRDLLYQTRLSGVDRDWTPPSRSRNVRYLQLAPGVYKLEIRAASPEGSVSKRPARMLFSIAPPVWQRWWFLAGSMTLVLAAMYRWHRWRLESRLAIERVRSRIATDLHDDIGASLSRIAMAAEVSRLGAEPGTESAKALGEIGDTARRLVEDMSDIVWSIDPRRDKLGDLVARVRAFGFDLLEPRGIRWNFDAPGEGLRRSLSPSQRRQLYLIFKEALHNIARHSQASAASLHIEASGQRLQATLEDDGRGIADGATPGLGIRSMTERAQDLGGSLRVERVPAGGTRVTLRFPLRVKDA